MGLITQNQDFDQILIKFDQKIIKNDEKCEKMSKIQIFPGYPRGK